MRILVAGAAGFLGWNLCRELRRRHRGAEIVGVDDLSTGVRRSGENVSDMRIGAIEEWFTTARYDYVYHLASPASPVKYQRNPLKTITSNIEGLWRCLASLAPTGTIFLASSSEVYGDPLISPQTESYKGCVSTTGPRACYDESKRMCETIMVEWQRAHPSQRCKIARLFNVYGPGTLPDDGRCVSNFVWDAMHGRPCTIYGDGMQTRAFTYVDNVVQAIVRLAEETGDFMGPVNIGTNVESTVRDIAVAVMSEAQSWRLRKGLTGLIPAPAWLPAAADDPRQRLPDLELAQRVLGWDTRKLVQLNGPTGGIARNIKYFEATYLGEDFASDNFDKTTASPSERGVAETVPILPRDG